MSGSQEYKLAKEKIEGRNYKQAEPILKHCMEGAVTNSEKAYCANALGLIYSEGFLGEVLINKAIINYRIAYELEPDKLEYVHNLGLSYYNAQAYRKAEPLLDRCAKASPDELGSYNIVTCASKLGWIYAEGKLGKVDLDKALANYKIAHRFEPDNEVFAYNLAHSANSLGVRYEKGWSRQIDLNKALEYYSMAHEVYPDEIIYNNHLAGTYYKLSNYKQAAPLFKRCVEADLTPTFSNVDKANCASTLGAIFNSEGLLDQAIESFSKAHELDPGNPLITHNLAHSYYNAKNYQQAGSLFKQCAEAEPNQYFTAAVKESCAYGVKLSELVHDEL